MLVVGFRAALQTFDRDVEQGKRVKYEMLPGGASFQYKTERDMLLDLFADYRKLYR